MHSIDWLVAALYIAAVVATGTLLGRRQEGASDYFLGRHSLPWWAVLVSVVATETSALTVISIPGIGYRGDLTFLQLAMGYCLGRAAVAWLLLPGYMTGNVQTAYELLGTRWGSGARRTASAIFMATRALATAVRLFAGAIPLAAITGWSYPTAILAVGVATVIYTYVGGLRAVVWVDVIQWTVYIIAGIATLAAALHLAPDSLSAAAAAGKLRIIDPGISLSRATAFGTSVIGGAFLSAASHGTDHLIVQRLLATRSLRAARAALIGSGLVVFAEFSLFLLVGVVLWRAYPAGATLPTGDAVFPAFVVSHLGGGLAGLVVAGILAAAMGSTASALNSLASATTHDYLAPLTGTSDDQRLLRMGRVATLGWAALLIGGALLFKNRDTPVVVVALSIASLTYGALLGAFVLARFARIRQADAVTALIGGSLLMALVVFAGPLSQLFGSAALATLAKLAWPWYVPLGLLVTLVIGLLSSFMSRTRTTTHHAPRTAAP